MVLESNVSAPSPTPSSELTCTSMATTSWTKDNADPSLSSHHGFPSSRKRKMTNHQTMGSSLNEQDASSMNGVQPTSHGDRCRYDSTMGHCGSLFCTDDPEDYEELPTSSPSGKPDWETQMPTLLSCDLDYPPPSPLQHPSVTTNNNSMTWRPDTHNLEQHVGDTSATPAYLDWPSGSVQTLGDSINTTTTTTTTATTTTTTDGTVIPNDDGLAPDYALPYYQCLDPSLYSARVTSRNTDAFAPSCLTLSSLEHQHRRPSSSAGDMQHIQSMRYRNNLHHNHRPTHLSLDVNNLSPAQDSSMTPSLFSPSFGHVLDDITMMATTSDALPLRNVSPVGTLSVGSDQHHGRHQLTNASYHTAATNMDMGTIYHHPHPPSPLSPSSSESPMTFEPTLYMDKAHLDSGTYTTNNLRQSHRRRSSNNTISSGSSAPDSLATPRSHAKISPLQSESISPTAFSSEHQQHYSYISPLSLELTSNYPPYGNSYPHPTASSTPLNILKEEEEGSSIINGNQYRCNNPNTHSTTPAEDIDAYLSSKDAVSSGELTVMISTSKVAQKSYGTEKRFICPPPSVILIGTKWWTIGDSNQYSDILQPPAIQIQMSNKPTLNDLAPIPADCIEWTTRSGTCWNNTNTLDSAPSEMDGHSEEVTGNTTRSFRTKEPIVSGRCISKHMYISDSDDKQKTVAMLVSLQLANGLDLGVFKSKDIKVISKPSKKRQSLKNMDSCVHHGSTVALFNRRRSQTVSTRYLSISNIDGSPIFYGNESESTWWPNDPPTTPGNVCFSAKTQTWDSFYIWIADESPPPKTKSTFDEKTTDTWPPPPSMALQPKEHKDPIPIYYNQHVMLQCRTTGLVSPILVIRKVGQGNKVIGGVLSDHIVEKQLGGEHMHDECLGDPVSQLHKVAFQVLDTHTAVSRTTQTSWTQPANYPSCMNDVVGIYRTSGQRQPTPPSSGGGTPHPAPFTTTSTPLPFAWLNPCDTSGAMQQGEGGRTPSDGPPAYQKRRVSIGINDAVILDSSALALKQQRRYSSANEQSKPLTTPARRRNSVFSSTSTWHEDISETCIWSIVGTDTATYSFCPTRGPQANVRPVAPGPCIKHYQLIKDNHMVIHGGGFTDDMVVWFGRCVSIMLRTTATELELLIPSTLLGKERLNRIQLLLVRGRDGIVYRTRTWF